MDSNQYQQGTTVTVLGNTGSLVKTWFSFSYTFSGWNTKSDGSGTSYAPGATFTMPAANMTLYAKWASNAGPVHTIAAVNGVSPALSLVRDSEQLQAQSVVFKLVPLGRMPVSTFSTAAMDKVLEATMGPAISVTNGLNFDGISDSSQAGVTGFQGIPPDTNGAVGATQYVQWVNSAFRVFDKSTGSALSGPIAGSALWNGSGTPCESNNDGDGIVQYDKKANRWVILQPVFSPPTGQPYYMCVAVSTTSDAMGTYNQYEFPISKTIFPDYPKLSVWPDGYYLSANQYNSSLTSSYGPEACVMDRASMLAGNKATMQCFTGVGSNYGTLMPSDLDGATPPPTGSPNYFLSLDTSGNYLNLWLFHTDFTNSMNSAFFGPERIPVSSFTGACNWASAYCVPQAGTGITLDSVGDRLMYRLAYRNMGANGETLVVNHSVDTGSGNVGVRWYQLGISGFAPSSYAGGIPTLIQQGTFAPDSNYRWMGSIAMDKIGDIAMGYSESSSSMYPSIYFTGQQPGEPLDTMEAEALIINGGGAETNTYQRWGDYSGMSVDPVDDCTFWYTNEYFASTGDWNWQTRIASFKFPGCQ